MQGYDYPNYLLPVLTGLATELPLPVACQDFNFTTTNAYTWLNGQPGLNSTNVVSINALDLNTIQANEQFYSGSSSICTQGTGATCVEDLNAVGTNQYGASYGKSFFSKNTCTSSIPAYLDELRQNTQDEHSGLSTRNLIDGQ